MNGYKGFKRDCKGLFCQPFGNRFDFEIGQTYVHKNEIQCCVSGFHFCHYSCDVFEFYPPAKDIVYHRICAKGLIMDEGNKSVCSQITIGQRLSIEDLRREMPSYIRRSDGKQEWWFEGHLHRDGDQPAILRVGGTQEWWQKGHLHRDGDQPAIITSMGSKEWWCNGYRHRNGDQPAVMPFDGSKEWWQNGKRHRNYDLPAIVLADGSREWWINGQRHRDNDQPAIIRHTGTQEWYQHDQRHRDGNQPAFIGAYGNKYWYHHGVSITTLTMT